MLRRCLIPRQSTTPPVASRVAGPEFAKDWVNATAQPSKPVLLKPSSSPYRRPSIFFSREPLADVPRDYITLDYCGSSTPLYRVTSSSCDYFALRIPLLKAGFKRVGNDAAGLALEANVLWGKSWPVAEGLSPPRPPQDSPFQRARPVHRFQRINHFAGSHANMGCKAGMARCLENTSTLLGRDPATAYLAERIRNMTPRTWRLPEQGAKLASYLDSNDAKWYIIKPARGSCGRGIRICSSKDSVLRALCNGADASVLAAASQGELSVRQPGPTAAAGGAPRAAKEVVVQDYLTNPLLIDGRKFDLRLYVAVTSFDPLVSYIHKEGLVRFAAVEYEASTVTDPSHGAVNRFAHLTNYSLGRRLEERKARELAVQRGLCEADEGGDAEWDALKMGPEAHLLPTVSLDLKWPLERLWKHISDHYGDQACEKLREGIDDVIVAMLAAGSRMINHISRRSGESGNANDTSFELLGFDIMIDDNLKPWLVEVNTLPSLESSSVFDYNVKSNVVTDLLNMAQIQMFERKPSCFEAAGYAPPIPPIPHYRSVMQPADAAWRSNGEAGPLGLHLAQAEDALDVQCRVADEALYCGNFRRLCPTQRTADVIRATDDFNAPSAYRTAALWSSLGIH